MTNFSVIPYKPYLIILLTPKSLIKHNRFFIVESWLNKAICYSRSRSKHCHFWYNRRIIKTGWIINSPLVKYTDFALRRRRRETCSVIFILMVHYLVEKLKSLFNSLILYLSSFQPLVSIWIISSIWRGQDHPVVGKCCPIGEVFVRNVTGKAVCTVMDPFSIENFSPIFYNFNDSGYSFGKVRSTFVAIIGNPLYILSLAFKRKSNFISNLLSYRNILHSLYSSFIFKDK